MNIPVKVENENDWEFVIIYDGKRKIMAVF
jgi:hypothetical protein